MGWANLPVEIQTIIFNQLEDKRKQLLRCQVVCKGWRYTAQKLLYSKVAVTVNSLVDFANHISESGGHIVKLRVYKSYRDEMNHTEETQERALQKIIRFCPNVEDLDVDASQLGRILNLHNKGKVELWNCLKEFQCYCKEDQEFADKNQLLLQFADSVEELNFDVDDLKSYLNMNHFYQGKFHEIIQYLNQFRSLKKLSITMKAYELNINWFDSLFDGIPSTTTDLRISTESHKDYDYPFPDDDYDDSLFVVHDKIKVMNQNLQTLSVRLPVLNAKTIQYVLNKFPRLTSLIMFDFKRDYHPVFHLPQDVLEKIIDYGSEMKTFELRRMRLGNQNEVLNTLIKKREMVKELVILYDTLHESSPTLSISKQLNSDIGTFSITSMANNADSEDILHSHREIFANYGRYLHTLEITNFTGLNWVDPRAVKLGILLHEIMQYCPSLETLIFSEDNDLSHLGTKDTEEQTLFTRNESITNLIIGLRCNAPSSTYEYFSQCLPSVCTVLVHVELFPIHRMYKKGIPDRLNELHMSMPDSQLDCITLKCNFIKEIDNQLCFIKLATVNSTRYFSCYIKVTADTRSLIQERDETAHQQFLDTEEYQKVAYFNITCKSLTKLIIDESNGLQRTYTF